MPNGFAGKPNQIWKRFYTQLPIKIVVLWVPITLHPTEHGGLKAKVHREIDETAFLGGMRKWESRKGVEIQGPEQSEDRKRLLQLVKPKRIMAAFLNFFLRQPIGPRIFISDRHNDFNQFNGRGVAVNQAFLSWFVLNNRERSTDGRLFLSIPCAGYRSRIEKSLLNRHAISLCLCSGNVSDLSGCCPHHRKPASKTLFNYYPLFEVEGYPELMD